MSQGKLHLPSLAWFLCLATFLGLGAASYAKLTAAPPQPKTVADTGPGFTVPLVSPAPAPELPAFDPKKADAVLLAFPSRSLFARQDKTGMSLGDSSPNFAAQLIRRGDPPEVLTEGVEFTAPVADTPPAGEAYEFPLVRVHAEGAGLKAETAVVLAASPAWGCGKCHGREPGRSDRSGPSPKAWANIFKAHDRLNRTELLADFESGGGVDCASCHDNDPSLPNLSAAIHGVHALVGLPDDERACNSCHPADAQGNSLFQRDLHAGMGLGCTSCHGALRDHALALLKAEAPGKPAAAKRMAEIQPTEGLSLAAINPRKPGENLPDCMGCHDHKTPPIPGEASAFNKWTKSADERFSRRFDDTGKLRCPTCHGAPHVMYPAQDLTGDNRDNFQAARYLRGDGPMGANKTCSVCHKTDMAFFIHHGLPE